MIVDKVKGFPLGFRAENTKLYDETATTLCNGTRPGWCSGVVQPQAIDCRNGIESSVNGTLQAKESGGSSVNLNNIVREDCLVRRLTPLECERLQGFPDGWTDMGEWIDSKGKPHKDSDSSRYKALGNSIAIPPWFYVLQKLALCCGEDRTMASLFDGIGGFPYIWERLNGEGSCLWASEIEEFPIIVTKVHFPEKEIHNESCC